MKLDIKGCSARVWWEREPAQASQLKDKVGCLNHQVRRVYHRGLLYLPD